MTDGFPVYSQFIIKFQGKREATAHGAARWQGPLRDGMTSLAACMTNLTAADWLAQQHDRQQLLENPGQVLGVVGVVDLSPHQARQPEQIFRAQRLVNCTLSKRFHTFYKQKQDFDH